MSGGVTVVTAYDPAPAAGDWLPIRRLMKVIE